MIGVVGAFFFWENYGRVAFTYDSVIVFKEPVQKGVIVEKQMLGRRSVDKGTLIEGSIKDPDLITGKRTNTYMPRGLQLGEEFFSDPELVTGDGSYIWSIPMDWIYSYPQSLRRGDLIYFYAIDKTLAEEGFTTSDAGDNTPLLSARIAYVKDSNNREVIDVTPDRMDGSATVTQIEIVISEEKYIELKNSAGNGKIFMLMYE